jgi:O-antigen/teichoic acid export membrane protein
VVPPVFIRQLSVEEYGIYSLLLGLTGYYSLLDLGLGRAVTKYVAEYEAKNDDEGIQYSVNAALAIQIVLGLIGSILLIILANPILELLKVSEQYFISARSGLYVSSIGFFFAMLASTLASALMGFQRYDLTSKAGGSLTLLFNVSLIISIYLGADLWLLILLKGLSQIVLFFIYYVFLQRRIPDWHFGMALDREYIIALFKFSIFLFSSRISHLFSNYFILFVISGLLGPSAVAYYQAPKKIINAFSGVLSRVFDVIFPYTSKIGANRNLERLKFIFFEASRASAVLSSPFFLFLIVFAKPLLTIWMGYEFAEMSWFILRLLALGSFFGTLAIVPHTMTIGLGYSKIYGGFSIATALFYLFFTPAFAKLWGMPGIGWATLLAVLPGMLLMVYEVKIIFGLDFVKYVKDILGIHLIFLVISLLIAIVMDNVDVEMVWKVLLFGCVYLFIYFGVIALFNWSTIRKFIYRLIDV